MSDSESIVSSGTEDDEPRRTKKTKVANKKAKILGSDDDSDGSSVLTDDDSIGPNVLESGSDIDDDSDMEDVDENELFQADAAAEKTKTGKKAKKNADEQNDSSADEFQFGFESDDEDEYDNLDEDDGEQYLQKLDDSVREQTIANHHPELIINGYEEVEALCVVVRDKRGIIIDPLHKTLPLLSKYERTRILGERAKQINDGAKPFVETDGTIIDGYLIALAEVEQNKIPFIIRRPLANGASEYWKLQDLEIL